MNLSNIFKTVKSLEIQDFDMYRNIAWCHLAYFKLNFPELIALKITSSKDLEHFKGLKLLRKISFGSFDRINEIY